MKFLDSALLVLGSLLVGWFLVSDYTQSPYYKSITADTPIYRNIPVKDTLVNVRGKKVLFIGDSHTAYQYGWQDQLAQKTGMTYVNTAVGGKRTDWMVKVALKKLDSTYDYCFIWGGANDMASKVSIVEAAGNIQRIVNMCNELGVKPIVLTGFDPQTCIRTVKVEKAWLPYPARYVKFQQELLDSTKHAMVIKNHFVSREDGDCADFICHMTASGHRRMADSLITACKFEVVSK